MTGDLMATNEKLVQNSNSPSLGYWAAHEQYSMQDLLRFVVEAEKTGCLGGMIMLMETSHGYG